MDDYRVCDMCRRVTFDAINTPDGFQHYKDVRLVCKQVSAENECRLCLFIADALIESPVIGESISQQLVDSQPPLAVRLCIPSWMRKPPAEKQPRILPALALYPSWMRKPSAKEECSPQVVDYSKDCPIFVMCGAWDYLKGAWEDEARVTMGVLKVYNKQQLTIGRTFGGVSSSSEDCFKIIQSWLRDCNSHRDCPEVLNRKNTWYLPRKRARLFPPRVIDVGPSNGSQEPFLSIDCVSRNTKSRQEFHRRQYIALSYCWGDKGNFTTTPSTLSARVSQMPLDDLPKTIKDAVTITRKLDIQYLWVDAICIIQGTSEEAIKDWQTHSTMMADIYGNAFLTIAAAAASDVHQGIFHDRRIPKLFRMPYGSKDMYEYITSGQKLKDDKLLAEPLSRRSWAFQERLLSQKVIAYGNSQLFWQCRAKQCVEDGSEREISIQRRDLFDESVFRDKARLSDMWHEIVSDYSTTNATYESDKLPALSGLAKTVQAGSGDEYIAGLWKRTISTDLCWEAISTTIRKPLRYRAPSWSWASIDGTIMWLVRDVSDLTLVEYSITQAGLDPFGQIADGWILVHAPLKKFCCIVDRHSHLEYICLSLCEDESSIAMIALDIPYPPTPDQEKNCWQHGEKIQIYGLRVAYGLAIALVPAESHEAAFRRIGMIRLNLGWLDGYQEDTVRIV